MRPLSFLTALLIAMIFSGCSCKKEPLPSPANTIGNKLSFKLNGQDWTANEINGGLFIRDADNYKYIYVYAYKGNETISLYITRPFVEGVKNFDQTTLSKYYTAYPKDYASFERYMNGSTSVWITNAQDIGQCNLTTVDTLNHKFKGSFSFKARNQSTNEVIEITNGYFEKAN